MGVRRKSKVQVHLLELKFQLPTGICMSKDIT